MWISSVSCRASRRVHTRRAAGSLSFSLPERSGSCWVVPKNCCTWTCPTGLCGTDAAVQFTVLGLGDCYLAWGIPRLASNHGSSHVSALPLGLVGSRPRLRRLLYRRSCPGLLSQRQSQPRCHDSSGVS